MIERDPRTATRQAYDLIVVGGGIYGACLAMESARRGLRPLLLERDDFGSATSWNSLRILHGGLRYLQTVDFRRFQESVSERTWFCRHFPDLVAPLECLMPLYGRGLKRPAVFRTALHINDFLSRHRNQGVRPDKGLPDGRVLDLDETRERFPAVATKGLRGAGSWWDAAIRHAPRVVVEMLRWACANGAVALNYVEAGELRVEAGRVLGSLAVDRVLDKPLEFTAPVVVNCAGPWARALAAGFDRDDEAIFRPSLAFNILLDREPLSECALAVAPRSAGARTYFMYPRCGRVFAGTFHAPWQSASNRAAASDALIDAFLNDLNEAVPGFHVSRREVLRVYAGLLPAKTSGLSVLSDRELLRDHGSVGGPKGLFTVSGVKFTTARLVAVKTLRAIFGGRHDLSRIRDARRPSVRLGVGFSECDPLPAEIDEAAVAEIRQIIETESVMTMDDLLLRRTDWGHDPRQVDALKERVRSLLGWAGRGDLRESHDQSVVADRLPTRS